MQGAAPCSRVSLMTSKHRITVNLTDDEYDRLENLAEKSKVSKAWLGRHAISSLLDRADKNDDQMPLPLPLARQRRGA